MATTTDDRLAAARARLAELRRAYDGCEGVEDDVAFVIPFYSAAPALLDVAEAAAEFCDALDQYNGMLLRRHLGAAEMEIDRNRAALWVASARLAIDAALARLGEVTP